MADMDYDREISPWGERGRETQTETEREGEEGKQEQATQDLEINVVPLALGIRNDRLLCEWLLWRGMYGLDLLGA